MSFGTVAALGPGSVTMHPVGGRTAEGQVFLMNPDHGTPAQIMVRSVRPNQAFSIGLPSFFIMSSPAGEDTMKVSALRSQWPVNSTGPGAATVVTIGGTLLFKGHPKPSAFAGSFALTVAYH